MASDKDNLKIPFSISYMNRHNGAPQAHSIPHQPAETTHSELLQNTSGRKKIFLNEHLSSRVKWTQAL